VVDLIAKTPLQDLLPHSTGTTTLSEATPARITSIMPFQNQTKACTDALKSAHAVGLPAIGRSSGKAGARVIWTGRNQFFFLADTPVAEAVAKTAALTDQTDGWAVMHLTGDQAAAVLARLTPIDLRTGHFKRGHTARTEMAHMMAVITRLSAGFEIMVMRSFAKTAVHHLKSAMDSIAAQSRLS